MLIALGTVFKTAKSIVLVNTVVIYTIEEHVAPRIKAYSPSFLGNVLRELVVGTVFSFPPRSLNRTNRNRNSKNAQK